MKYVVTYQTRRHHAPGQPGDGVDKVMIETAEGLNEAFKCQWITLKSVYELGARMFDSTPAPVVPKVPAFEDRPGQYRYRTPTGVVPLEFTTDKEAFEWVTTGATATALSTLDKKINGIWFTWSDQSLDWTFQPAFGPTEERK